MNSRPVARLKLVFVVGTGNTEPEENGLKAEDFTAWLSAISGMNEGQRAEAVAALEKARAVGAEGRGSAKKAGKHGRQEDALGTTSVGRVAAQGCPHLRDARSSVGAARTDFCGFAARAVGAPSMR